MDFVRDGLFEEEIWYDARSFSLFSLVEGYKRYKSAVFCLCLCSDHGGDFKLEGTKTTHTARNNQFPIL